MAESTETQGKPVILIAMDGSDHSYFAFDWYISHLYKKGNEVIVVHCPDYKHVIRTPVMSTDPTIMARIVRQGEEETNKLIEQIKARLADCQVDAKMQRLSGEPGHAIIKAAKEHKATCIVTGTRGQGTVRRTVLGSVSSYVLHHAHCPVLVCRRKN